MNDFDVYKIRDSVDIFLSDEKYLLIYYMNTRRRKSFKVNETMIQLIQKIDGIKTLKTLCDEMFSEYQIFQDQFENVIQMLVENRIITKIPSNQSILDDETRNRFARQINYFAEFLDSEESGLEAQRKIINSCVTIFGCGAIGGNIAIELAMSGVGSMKIFDRDIVSESDVSRHMFFKSKYIGQKKIIALANELKQINPKIKVEIPLRDFTCIIGESGSGKSSLVYDTLFAESQRNFLSSMSSDFNGQKLMDKPKVDSIENLHPALDVAQNYYNVNPRSTIGTITDVSYYLRTLFALVISQENHVNLSAGNFSANNPASYCERCHGTGESFIISESKLIPDESKSLSAGGILFFKGSKTSLEYKLLESECKYWDIDINKRIADLTKIERDELLNRTEEIQFQIRYKNQRGVYRQKIFKRAGVMVELNKLLQNIDQPSTLATLNRYLEKVPCESCHGQKLKSEILALKIRGLNISEIENLNLLEMIEWIESVTKKYSDSDFANQIAQLTTEITKKFAQ